MGIIFGILCIVIGGYWYLTDSGRIGRMAEAYLSSLLGGTVHVGSANLSIFEGMRLEDVKLSTPTSRPTPTR